METRASSVAAAVPAAFARQRPARPPLQGRTRDRAFTVVELLIVMAIILVLAGLILATSGYVQKKGSRSRAEAEIAAISAALENYKADNGIYPSDADTNALKANTMGNPTQSEYQKASLALYKLVSGDADNSTDRSAEMKTYFSFKPNQLSPSTQNQAVTYIKDPFGNSYGYSTIKAAAPSGSDGYNPTFDLWSTGGVISASNPTDQSQWIKNW
jgi:prepilin-type N-terminal cleavage/methylation domain-containing protein